MIDVTKIATAIGNIKLKDVLKINDLCAMAACGNNDKFKQYLECTGVMNTKTVKSTFTLFSNPGIKPHIMMSHRNAMPILTTLQYMMFNMVISDYYSPRLIVDNQDEVTALFNLLSGLKKNGIELNTTLEITSRHDFDSYTGTSKVWFDGLSRVINAIQPELDIIRPVPPPYSITALGPYAKIDVPKQEELSTVSTNLMSVYVTALNYGGLQIATLTNPEKNAIFENTALFMKLKEVYRAEVALLQF